MLLKGSSPSAPPHQDTQIMERRKGEPVALGLKSDPSLSSSPPNLTPAGEITGVPQPFDPLFGAPPFRSNDKAGATDLLRTLPPVSALEATSREDIGSKTTTKDGEDGGNDERSAGLGGTYPGYGSAARRHSNSNYYDKKWIGPSKS